MNWKSQKGITGVDISISVVVIFMFVTLISVLVYNYNSTAKELEIKSDATYCAISEIEQVKINGFETYQGKSVKNGNSIVCENEKIENQEGFYKTIIVEDYTDLEGKQEKIGDIVKRVTVKISYMYKGNENFVQLATILSKGE